MCRPVNFKRVLTAILQICKILHMCMFRENFFPGKMSYRALFFICI